MNLVALHDFAAIAHHGSLVAASLETGVPRSTLSKRLQNLESSLGLRLFERNTRALRLTDDGALLLERATTLLQDADDLKRYMQTRNDAPFGRLRISVPSLFGNLAIGRIAALYRQEWPETTLEVQISDRRVDLVEEGYDCAIRVGELEDSNMVCRTMATSSAIVVASPALAKKYTLDEPAQLKSAPSISFLNPYNRHRWVLTRGDEDVGVDVRPVLSFSSVQAVFEAARSGGGFALVPSFIARKAIADGSLVHVLEGWVGGMHPISIIYPSRHYVSGRLRAFIDLVDREVKKQSEIAQWQL
ncbi:LysR family transcriptional regulator [Natronospirillum operosum]|nr:LysR family transcriptional regulator [Natronospirillum operosum]